MRRICVIFDLDGTLVDSEGLCNQAFLDLLPALTEGLEFYTARYRGQKLSDILSDIETRLDEPLPADFEQQYRTRVAELFANCLRPIPGAIEMLTVIDYPRCIASSGPLAKIRQSLNVTGLSAFFSDNLFSSYEVGTWKPDPGLFLHAATTMGFTPDECIVVEDSEVGIEAAAAAGMHGLLYSPDESSTVRNPGNTFSDMRMLPLILRRLETTA